MKILRQKLFTFQDKKAWEELKAATNNFTTLPNGRGKMNARDVIRFKKWAELVDQGRMNEVDWNEAKKVFEHIDLPETAKGLEHLSHKYRLIRDPKFQNRYKSVMSPGYRRTTALRKNLAKRETREYFDLIKKYPNMSASDPLANEQITRYNRLQRKNADRFDREYKEITPLLDDASGFDAHEKAVNLNNRIINRKNASANKRRGGRSERFLMSCLENDGVTIKQSEPGRRNYFSPTDPNNIYLSTKSPSTGFHEYGHLLNNRKGYIVSPRRLRDSGPLSVFAEENLASSRALAKVRRGIKLGKLNPKVEKRYRGDLETAIKTYYHNGIQHALVGIEKAVKR